MVVEIKKPDDFMVNIQLGYIVSYIYSIKVIIITLILQLTTSQSEELGAENTNSEGK